MEDLLIPHPIPPKNYRHKADILMKSLSLKNLRDPIPNKLSEIRVDPIRAPFILLTKFNMIFPVINEKIN